MPRLLRENDVAPAFRSMRASEAEAVVAVPFWGIGATCELGLGDGRGARVVCNLASTGCNPYEIETLTKAPGVTVSTNPRLHAKIYATANTAVVGSSNASANGLLIEGNSQGWIEANVISNEPGFVSEIRGLFDTIWDDVKTELVTDSMLDVAKKAWKTRPKLRLPFRAKTLLAACRERPEDFCDVYVAAYAFDLGKEGAKALSKFKKRVAIPDSHVSGEEISAKNFRKAWGYQFEDVPDGAWLIDLDCRNLRKPRVHGCSRSKGVQLNCGEEVPVTIAIRGVVRIDGTPNRLPIASEEKAALIKNAMRIFSKSKDRLLVLPDVLRIIDGSK